MSPSFRAGAAVVGAALVVPALAAAAPAPRPTTPEDLTRIAYVSTAAISHHGDRVAFVVTKLDVVANRYVRNIWLVRADGTGLRQLTQGNGDTDPQWSPDDGTLAFTGARGGPPQIYTLALDGGEARKLTTEANGASGPRWSHDGTRILYGATFEDAQPKTHFDAAAAGADLDDAHKHTDVRVTDRLDFEANGAGETFRQHTHLVVVRADGAGRTRITPLSPWSETAPAWSYDDRSIAFVTLRRPVDPDRLDSDVYVVGAHGGALRRVPTAHRASGSPAWSHDGSALFLTVGSEPDPAGLPGIDRAPLAGGERRIVPENTQAFGDAMLTDTKEGGAGCGPLLEPHDRWFVADVTVAGATVLRRFDAATGRASDVVARGDEIADCSANDALTTLAYTASDATHPAEVFVYDAARGTSRQLTHLNAAYLASTRIAAPQPFTVHDERGFAVHAWFLPARVPRGTRAPTLLEIHGGPQSLFGNSFFHELQMLAGRGYNVVYANPRGSVGYGYAFEAAISKDWGEPMFRDEMAVVDAVAKRPEVDSARLGVLGGSYGGYATLWVIGHTHRFKAALAERAVSDMTSAFLSCDECSNVSARYAFGNAWSNQDAYWRMSPIASVADVKTPLLLLHSDEDTRTPLVDSDSWFTLAKSLDEPITYVQVPRENHDFNRTGEPVHRMERLHLIADWFAKEL
ncbi:MAG: S9 family peptidase [Candidatus Eremiobacteraeota bacterium]|nr:S9 family peptidase [Candidatus Eremiobacteraeota bacterium]